MKPQPLSGRWTRAYTLVELLISTGVAGVLLAGLIATAITLKNTYSSCDEYNKALSDQSRVLDQISMDLRRAKSGSVSNTAQTLTLVLVDYLDSSSNPRMPTISTSSRVSYGASATLPSVVYTITGTSPNQIITRTYTPSTGSATTTTLTAEKEDYNFACVSPTNSGSVANFSFGGSGQPTGVKVSITFKPRFNRLGQATARATTVASVATILRNHL